MKGFLFDQNLPSRLRFEPRLPLVPLAELGPNPTDTQVWDFARQRSLVIVSKDADFSERIILSTPPPWVVHVRLGNLRRSEFHLRLAREGRFRRKRPTLAGCLPFMRLMKYPG